MTTLSALHLLNGTSVPEYPQIRFAANTNPTFHSAAPAVNADQLTKASEYEKLSDDEKIRLIQTLPIQGKQWLKKAGMTEAGARQLLRNAFNASLGFERLDTHSDTKTVWGSSLALGLASDDTSPTLTTSSGQPNPENTASFSNYMFSHSDFICAERDAIKRAVTNYYSQPQFEGKRNGEIPKPEVKAISVILRQFEDPSVKQMVSCDKCLESFQYKNAFMNPEKTLYVYLNRGKGNQLEIQVRPLKEILPLMNKTVPSYSEKPIRTLPVVYSPHASILLQKRKNNPFKHITDRKVKSLIRLAKKAYEESVFLKRSSRNNLYAGAAALYAPHHFPWMEYTSEGQTIYSKNSNRITADVDAISRGVKISWTFRLVNTFIKPVEQLAQHFHQKTSTGSFLNRFTGAFLTEVLRAKEYFRPRFEKKPANDVVMMGYFSKNDPYLPNPQSLTFINKTSGNEDTLIAVIENDTIQVRTIKDYMPIQYRKTWDVEHLSQQA
ncbi:MAG: hypothetical protein KTR14_07505 [Vampirovibrio sp.]|nr:hypothetical protein [Vampirovibrio sp.]